MHWLPHWTADVSEALCSKGLAHRDCCTACDELRSDLLSCAARHRYSWPDFFREAVTYWSGRVGDGWKPHSHSSPTAATSLSGEAESMTVPLADDLRDRLLALANMVAAASEPSQHPQLDLSPEYTLGTDGWRLPWEDPSLRPSGGTAARIGSWSDYDWAAMATGMLADCARGFVVLCGGRPPCLSNVRIEWQGTKGRVVVNYRTINMFLSSDTSVAYEYPRLALGVRGSVAIKLDLADAFRHVPVAREDRQYLAMDVAGVHLTYAALPFGLAHSPRMFSLALRPVVVACRALNVRLVVYCDDFLVIAQDVETLVGSAEVVIPLLIGSHWRLSAKKLFLAPMSRVLFLGLCVELDRDVLSIPRSKASKVESMANLLSRGIGTLRSEDSRLAELLVEQRGSVWDIGGGLPVVHCVSADLARAAGVAAQAVAKLGPFPPVSPPPAVGSVICQPSRGTVRLFELVTKRRYFQKPSYGSLRQSLVRLTAILLASGVGHVVMPRIGAGRDELEWDVVRSLILDTLCSAGIKVTVATLRQTPLESSTCFVRVPEDVRAGCESLAGLLSFCGSAWPPVALFRDALDKTAHSAFLSEDGLDALRDQLSFWVKAAPTLHSYVVVCLPDGSRVIYVVSDASDTGWGAAVVPNGGGMPSWLSSNISWSALSDAGVSDVAFESWSAEESRGASGLRELLALHRGARRLRAVLSGCKVIWSLDATAAVNSAVGWRSSSPAMRKVLRELWDFLQRNNIMLVVRWVRRSLGWQPHADWLSRVPGSLCTAEWAISVELWVWVKVQLWSRFRVSPSTDLFATAANARCASFHSRWVEAGSRGDAFNSVWSGHNWAFPPRALVLDCLAHFGRSPPSTILVILASTVHIPPYTRLLGSVNPLDSHIPSNEWLRPVSGAPQKDPPPWPLTITVLRREGRG